MINLTKELGSPVPKRQCRPGSSRNLNQPTHVIRVEIRVHGRRVAVLAAAASIVAVGYGCSSPLPAPSPSAVATPVARWLGAFFYDPQAHRVFLYGGQTFLGVGSVSGPITHVSDMWNWNGRSWTFVPPPSDGQLPTARARELTAYDPDHKRILLFGGTDGQQAFGDYLSEVWSWSDGQWSRLPNAPIVATSGGGAMAYDPSRHELVVLTMPPTFHWGPDDPNAFQLDTWLRNDQGWRQARPQHRFPFAPTSMIFDSSRDRILASRQFGNETEIWSWDGQDWNLTSERLPGARAVLVDGGDLGILAVDSTGLPGRPRPVFRLKGNQWIAAGPLTTGPSVALSPAYDQSRRELVTFGDGWQNGAAPVETDDTWTWTLTGGWRRHAGHAPCSLNPNSTTCQAAAQTATVTPPAVPHETIVSSAALVAHRTVIPGSSYTTTDGQWTAYSLPTQYSLPGHIAQAADGSVWFTETNAATVGRIDEKGNLAEFVLPDSPALPGYIAAGPDGAMWFTEPLGKIARITSDGHLTDYTLAKLGSSPQGITLGPDGAMWFADERGNYIGRITTLGALSGFPLPDRGAVQCGWVCPHGIVTGPDGALWFTEEQISDLGGNRVGRMTTAGGLTEYLVPTWNSSPSDITVGGDGNIWFSEARYGHVGRVAPAGSVTEFTLHTARLGAVALGMAKGPFDNVWFPVGRAGAGVAATGNQLGRIAADGTITGYVIPGRATVSGGIAIADDGAVWFTYGHDQIWRFVPKQ